MENTSNIIKTDEGKFIINHFGKDFSFEKFDLFDEGTFLMVDYISDSSVINDNSQIINLFSKFDLQIIELTKFIISENIEFYKHFNIDFNLQKESLCFNQIGKQAKHYKIFKTELI